jgi:hypothetical protein
MAGEIQGRAIFISYRRDDTEGEAGRLFDDLTRAYGDDSVFMDVTGIQPGLDFRKAIDANVGSCGVLLAMIGVTWATVTDTNGNRRLDNANDFVRLEIATALARGTPVIPVLVHGARMPAAEQLPDDLKDLAYRNSVEITHARWNSDVALLTTALKSYVNVNAAHETDTVHATVPVQLPAPQPSHAESPTKKSKAPLWIGIGAAAAIAVAAILFLTLHSHSTPQPQPTITPATTTTTPATAPATTTTPASDASASPAASQPAGTPSPATSGSAEPAAPSAFLGNWKIAEELSGGDPLARISIGKVQGQFVVQAWGMCAKKGECDWGSRPAAMRGSDLVTGAWELRNSPTEIENKRNVILTLTLSGNGLQAKVRNQTQSPDGQIKDGSRKVQFEREP